jgi:hypothetical protein
MIDDMSTSFIFIMKIEDRSSVNVGFLEKFKHDFCEKVKTRELIEMIKILKRMMEYSTIDWMMIGELETKWILFVFA